ncbi:MAG: hypothetical protein IJV97_00940 [Alphaproteobacteria bacterium]|nr:hypothetical protein [Alphaproteobacteria bacterium]
MTDNPFIEHNENRKSKLLFDYINQITKSKAPYSALLLRLYKLQNQPLNSVLQQIVADAFAPLGDNSKVFYLNNDNAVIVFNTIHKDEILSCLVKLKFSLQNDTDMQKTGIAQFYDLLSQTEDFKKAVSIPVIANKTSSANTSEQREQAHNAIYKRHLKKELSPEMLAKVQKILSVADFSSFIRRQAVCAIIGKSVPQRVYDEVYVSIPDLREMLLPDVDLTSNPWLFWALSETLDRRVLQTVSRHDDGSLLGNFSININVSTILSDDFMYFDDNINASMRSSVVLELQLMDIFSDIKAYQLAKTFAQARGYKVCIDGITVDKLNYINKSNLNCDLMKIIWHPSFADIIHEDKHFTDYENKSERAKIILCRIDDPKAVEIGNSIGINLYQGRLIQRLLSQNSSLKK